MAEPAYISSYLAHLIQRDIILPPDYVAPPDVQVPAIPTPSRPVPVGLTLVLKSLKPPFTLPLTIPSTLPVTDLKRLLVTTLASSPSPSLAPHARDFSDPDALRLVVGGKPMLDGKTVHEYGVKEGGTVHVLRKAGGGAQAASSTPTTGTAPAPAAGPATTTTTTIPTETNTPQSQPPPASSSSSSSSGLSKTPSFLPALRAFLATQFTDPGDAERVYERFKAGYEEM
ncbi:hypothetical protein HDU93_003415, partial [Gonapodya sp. JEL0774]